MRIVREAVPAGDRGHAPPGEPGEPAVLRRGPHSAVIFGERHDPFVRQPVGTGQVLESAVPPSIEAIVGPDPEGRGPVLEQGADSRLRGRKEARLALEAASSKAQHALVGPGPERPFAVLEEREHDVLTEPARRVVAREAIVLAAEEAAPEGPYPEPARTVFEEGLHPVVGERLRVALVEYDRAHAVEPSQALDRPHPEVAVPRLHHRRDVVVGQRLGSPPGLTRVLGGLAVGIEGQDGAGESRGAPP